MAPEATMALAAGEAASRANPSQGVALRAAVVADLQLHAHTLATHLAMSAKVLG